jgi:hypothetical protein
MISLALLMLPEYPYQAFELATFDPKKIDLTSVVISNDGNRSGYLDPKRETLYIDRKKIGKYLAVKKPVFSSDSKDWAAIVYSEPRKPTLVINGMKTQFENPVIQVEALVNGSGFAVTEQDSSQALCRYHFNGKVSEWVQRIERVRLSPGLNNYVLECSEDIMVMSPVPNSQELKKVKNGTRNFVLKSGGEKEELGTRYLIFPMDDGGFIEYFNSANPATYSINGQLFELPGSLVGAPIIGAKGQVLVKSEFTGVTDRGNAPFSQYAVNGLPLEDLQFQTGFQFTPDGKSFVLNGTKDRVAYLQRGFERPVPINSLPGLESLPQTEMYKSVRFTDGRLVLVFQSKKVSPLVWIEGLGSISLNVRKLDVESLSFSPNGKEFVFLGELQGKVGLYRQQIAPNAFAELIGPVKYQAQTGIENRPQWLSPSKVQYLGIEGNTLSRIVVDLK